MKKLKKIMLIILGIIIGTSTIVGAATIFNSKDITYSSDKTDKTNVKDSLDELYSKLGKCPVNNICYDISNTIASKVNVGDYISMTPSSTSYTISKALTGYESDQIINPSKLNIWRVLRKMSDGTIEVVSEHVTEGIKIKGNIGYKNYIGLLNTIAKQFIDVRFAISARSFGSHNGIEFCDNIWDYYCRTAHGWTDEDYYYETQGNLAQGQTLDGINQAYYSAQRYSTDNDGKDVVWGIYFINREGKVSRGGIYEDSSKKQYEYNNGVRVVLNLRNREFASGDGKSKETAYQFE